MKKNTINRIFVLIAVLSMLMMSAISVSAASYSNVHNGTYNMTGGIFYKKSFISGTEMRITIMPDTGTYDCYMGIYTAENSFLLGWQGADYINSVPSISYSETEYTTTKKIDGIYFRNWSGYRWIGAFKVEW